jgi:recombination protein RecT
MSNLPQIKNPNQPVGTFQAGQAVMRLLEPQLKAYMSRVEPEIITNAMINSFRQTPQLLECSVISIMSSLIACADLGLVPNTQSGECYLIPYRDKKRGLEAQFMLGYKGAAKLARLHSEVDRIQAWNAYSNEVFDVEFGTTPHVKHTPIMDATTRGEYIATYAVGFTADGLDPVFEVVRADEMLQIKKAALAKCYNEAASPWTKWEEEMRRGKAIKRLCKYLETTPTMAKAIDLDDRLEAGKLQLHDVRAENMLGVHEAKRTAKADELAQKLSDDDPANDFNQMAEQEQFDQSQPNDEPTDEPEPQLKSAEPKPASKPAPQTNGNGKSVPKVEVIKRIRNVRDMLAAKKVAGFDDALTQAEHLQEHAGVDDWDKLISLTTEQLTAYLATLKALQQNPGGA